ncbi:hypothetical protein [Paraglaciecola sp. 2405UD69-4]|uniref:hypothetical protein n=1 Tax=Paraglaciecola sp. 2405UD69-4 TaxID=3391836 RepID=UPI0039C8EDCF
MSNSSSVSLGYSTFLCTILSLMLGCTPEQSVVVKSQAEVSPAQKFGTRYSDVTRKHFKAPEFKPLALEKTLKGASVWGATGRDDLGNIYFGVSTTGQQANSTAYLYQYNPNTDKFMLQGDVLSQLKRLNLFQQGMGQNKLHSKFYQAADGYVYFSSFDEAGETSETNPEWGGHLWRKLPSGDEWEHLLSSEEALIAVNTTGRYVYTLGYWEHVLYQYDTVSGNFDKITVGSVKGHVSRNFLVDLNEHVYIPKVSFDESGGVETFLVEYDTRLTEVNRYSLPTYSDHEMWRHHGIVSYTGMGNGDIFFITSEGALYQLVNNVIGPEKLKSHGLLYPEGNAYIPSLFSVDGKEFLMGLSKRNTNDTYEWFVRENISGVTATYSLPQLKANGYLLYGSVTRDNNGDLYVVGTDVSNRNEYYPTVYRVQY